jgi:hypothetical protein
VARKRRNISGTCSSRPVLHLLLLFCFVRAHQSDPLGHGPHCVGKALVHTLLACGNDAPNNAQEAGRGRLSTPDARFGGGGNRFNEIEHLR